MIYPDNRILLGLAPTRRDDLTFPVETALENKKMLFAHLDKLGIEYVHLDDVCPDGMLVTLEDVAAAEKKFRQEGVHAVFTAFTNFGCEGAVSMLARAMNLPLLLWGPREYEGFGYEGKCTIGLYAAGKDLLRMGCVFSYIPNCYLEDELFERGLRTFLAAANVLKEFRRARILQVGPRPESFWSVIFNEGELLERFKIPVYPLSLQELFDEMQRVLENHRGDVDAIVESLRQRTSCFVADEEVVVKSAAMKIALEGFARQTQSTGIAIQCWYAMQKAVGIWPCTAGSLLTEMGIPVACETDVLGALSCVMAQAATMGRCHPFFVDWGWRHPDNPKALSLVHCGITPIANFAEMPCIAKRRPPWNQAWGGGVSGLVKPGDNMSYLRMDSLNGEYSVLLGGAKSVDGPVISPASYLWIEVPNLLELDYKLTVGPYIHHCVFVHEDILPVMSEALRYMAGIKPDFVFEEERKRAQRFFFTD